jgi:hypothetical protein
MKKRAEMQTVRLLIALLLVAAGCAHTPPPSPAAPAESTAPEPSAGDPVLHQIMSRVPLDSAGGIALQRYELDHPISFLDNVAEIAEGAASGVEARYNAVSLLGERAAARYTPSLRAALGDRDPRVRAAAVVAAGKILDKTGRSGLSVLVAALADSAPEVQATALQVLGARDVALLRDFLARHQQGETATIARDLLHAAEQRGAPLAPDSAGVLRRTTNGGLELEFRPSRRWAEWGAATGAVTIRRGTSPVVTIPDVEVVSDVVPVFFAPDEGAIVYEQGRRIRVRDLRSGEIREVGGGIAPRPLPFTDDFIYVRVNPQGTGDLRERTRINYDVLRAGFRPRTDDPRYLGALEAFTEMKQRGNYSPVRWGRIVEKDAQFTLEAQGAQTFKLPDPFKSDQP